MIFLWKKGDFKISKQFWWTLSWGNSDNMHITWYFEVIHIYLNCDYIYIFTWIILKLDIDVCVCLYVCTNVLEAAGKEEELEKK